MTADPFTRWEELKQEFADALEEMHEAAQDYENTIHPIELMDPEEFRRGQRMQPCPAN